ncbi:MAG: hypothetical protein EXS01_07220 [Phycisphaerales bacterium]|nr:hypothetical protein [Phycisphaerales bacterium]
MMILRSVCFGLALSTAVGAQTPAPAPAPAPNPAPTQATAVTQDIQWQMKMGVRSFQVSARVPVVDKVVLVPDGATYLDELSKWTLRGRWPVLIEDDFFAPMFVRAFKPSKVLRRTSVGAMPATEEERRALARHAVTRAWTVPGSDANPASPAEAYASVRFEPMGIVLTNMSDGAWPAAVALAAGHGQVLNWLDGSFDNPSSVMTPTQLQALSVRVEEVATATGLSYNALGDAIDAVTICRLLPGKAEAPLSKQFAPPAMAPVKPGEPIAVTDALCRNVDGTRWGIASWIFGSEVQSAYMAMCSLYLAPRTTLFVNTYQNDGDWKRYAVTDAVTMLTGIGYETTEISGSAASVVPWLNLLMGGFKSDVLYMNSMGNMDFFNMWNAQQCYPEDVPMLQRPLAMHLIHSWSLTSPESRETVGGRWLEHGVYAYAGSVFEPYLIAFVPPGLVAQRTANFIPFLVASRWCEGPVDAVWRVTTIGDPLMVMMPPSQPRAPRDSKCEPNKAASETDVKESALAALVAAKASESAADYARALADVVLTGDDALAGQLWSLAASKGPQVAAACAPIALGALFRERANEAFLEAYRLIAKPTLIDQDMLWHLWTQQLASVNDRARLEWFATQVRAERPEVDLSRLAPEISRVAGVTAARETVAGWVSRAPAGESRNKVNALLGNLQ